MRTHKEALLFSATDLVTFLGCRHATYLDHRQLTEPVALLEAGADPYIALLQQKGLEHERRHLEQLRATGRGLHIVEISGDGSLEARTRDTQAAMREGADVIYQGAFVEGCWHGYADFLLRVPGASALGGYHYEPLDTKLSHTVQPKHVVQLGIYAGLVAAVQGRAPERLHVVLGTGQSVGLATRDFQFYLDGARDRFEAYANALPAESVGEPCNACSLCRWRERCEGEWAAANHLSLVAGITRSQVEKLNLAGIQTLAQLAALPPGTPVPKLASDTLARLYSQARLQEAKRRDGQNHCECVAAPAGKGFERLPAPSAGDLFFDMEGDPLVEGGLEYLFGFIHEEGGNTQFTAFWGHDRHQERSAFEAAMDFITARLKAFPAAHVYHYAQYEESALKRLAMRHGTREAEVDNLLREHQLVDLYRVVREAVRTSEPAYSIKNLETFYMPGRQGEVTSAGTSVVVYERWRLMRDDRLLEEISAYNRTDCLSTLKLRDWLISLRPPTLGWYAGPAPDPKEPERTAERNADEARTLALIHRLTQGSRGELEYRELIGHLLQFHRREAKPRWWGQFYRAELSTEELIEDAECLGALVRDPASPPFPEKRSIVHTFTFPPQDYKLRKGDRPRRAGTAREPSGEIVLVDAEAHRIQLKIGPKTPAPPDELSLIPEPPLDDRVLKAAVARFAESIVAGNGQYTAIESVLKRELPRIHGRRPGDPVVPPGTDTLAGTLTAIAGLDRSHLLIQGPPGAGKTYVSATSIVQLLAAGKRVGVASNSHKAINQLLQEVARHAARHGVVFRGVKKCSEDEHRCEAPAIENVFDNDEVTDDYSLVAGTAWLFALPQMDQALDFLFVDEAGQVSLGNLVAMGAAARNLVLVGDQMQLSQPIQGVHPGRSGLSALEFLLADAATVPPERGIFLDLTRRMHPDVCRFISDAVYEGRLHSYPSTAAQRIILGPGADPALKPTGLSFVPVAHEDCRQKSEEEAQRVRSLFDSLLAQRCVDQYGTERPLRTDDILVVTPYNMQVNLLKTVLPAGARVGTVDKFQGQEGQAVVVSMTTSAAEDIPRGIEFLYSRNRLNVAISRARALAIIVASPTLLEASCTRVEQMALVNTLCFARAYAQ